MFRLPANYKERLRLRAGPAKVVEGDNENNGKRLSLRPDEQLIVDGAFVWANMLKTVQFNEEIGAFRGVFHKNKR